MVDVKSQVFLLEELCKPYELSPKLLPTKNDCLLYVLTRTRHGVASHDQVVLELARKVENIWKAADCCPSIDRHIVKAFKRDIWEKYLYILREKCLPCVSLGKRSHKKDESKKKKYNYPRRKSSRLEDSSNSINQATNETREEAATESLIPDIPVPNAPVPPKNTRQFETTLPLRGIWNEEGSKLFDVKSDKKIKSGQCFDCSFYEDQRTERNYEMYLSKVTKEFIEQEEKRKKREAIAEQNRISALGDLQVVNEGDNPDDDVQQQQHDEDDVEFTKKGNNELSNLNFSYSTPNKTGSCHETKNMQTQTETTQLNVPLRVQNRSGKCNLVEPRYLEGLSLLMAENLSASEAIRAVHIVDTVIWGQIRHLPLRMDKSYMKAYKCLKKLQSQSMHNRASENVQVSDLETSASTNSDHIPDMILQQVASVENDAIKTVTNANPVEEGSNVSPEIRKLNEFVCQKIQERSNDLGNTLPDVSCVRHNHNLLAVCCEGRVAEELVSKKGFIMPDGTSRQGVGDMAATVMKIGDKFRTLKSVKITKGTTNNWANAVVYMLQRLGIASNNDIQDICKSVSAIISDLCKVNKNLAVEIKEMIGSSWQPGQAFCNLHFTLAIPEAIKSVLGTYQSYIGSDKLFPKTVGFEMNLEDKLIIIQILDCWMRLTSIRWQSRAWNRYKSFTDFAEKRGIQNVGHMLHANRFGEFEERCAGGLYLIDTWLEWLSTFTDVRNQLACYLREVESLVDQCKFLWAGVALIGLHLTVPFMSMLLDHRATPRQLLVILPKLHSELKSYPETLCKIDECGIPSMKPYYLNPLVKETSPYGYNVCQSLSSYLITVDHNLMDIFLKKLCSTIGDSLKRQGGDQYGFGDNPDSDQLVTKNLPDAIMDDSDASHTKPIENYFGNFDRELKKAGAQGFDNVSDDLLIKYSKDLIDDGYKWKTKANRKKADELKLLQNEFNKKQTELIKMGVEEEDAVKLTHENKVLKCISMCKKLHAGPLTTTDELRELIQTWKGTQKKLHTSLNYEIRLRKFTFTQVKADCALFKQKNLTVEEKKKKNLASLINTQLEFRSLADMSDLEHAILESSNSNIEDIPEDTSKDSSQLHDSSKESVDESDIWPPKKGQFVFGLFEDGIFPGEVKQVTAETVNIDILVRATVPKMDVSESLWKRPSMTMNYNYTLDRDSVLPFYPVTVINRYSTHRVIIYEMLNYDLAEKFA